MILVRIALHHSVVCMAVLSKDASQPQRSALCCKDGPVCQDFILLQRGRSLLQKSLVISCIVYRLGFASSFPSSFPLRGTNVKGLIF